LVSRKFVGNLLNLAIDIQYLYERARDVRYGEVTRVKGESYVLATMQQQLWLIDKLANENSDLKDMKTNWEKWVSYLDKKYHLKDGSPEVNSNFLTKEDAKKLEDLSKNWRTNFLDLFYN